MKRKAIITVDGPSGAGKSTVARMLAQTLGFVCVDTGAMYRAVALARSQQDDKSPMAEFLASLSLKFEFTPHIKVFLGDRDISEEIRRPKVAIIASELSRNPQVRAYLMDLQRKLGKDGGVVLEGRDMGSVVFPEADFKFFLDARQDERAKRRFGELKEKGIDQPMGNLEKEMAERDRNDSERDIAPLVIPEGAIYVDSTDLDIQSVVRFMVGCVQGREVP